MKNTFLYGNNISNVVIGGKASNLLKLEGIGANVPKWGVIPAAVLLNQIPSEETEISQNIKNASVSKEIISEIKNYFGADYNSKSYAIRSSAIDEDGTQFSFAGQFETFLHVKPENFEEKIKAIWNSVISDRVLKYRKENKLSNQYGIAVIIQEMIPSEVSGVAFGLNPVTGNKNEKIISSVYGLGEGLVSGELDADTYTISEENLESIIAKKTHQFVQSTNGSGIEKVGAQSDKQNLASLSLDQVGQIGELLDILASKFGAPQDIEFAFYKDQLFLLQTRPITSSISENEAEYILWDNSNIIESYPGITTPLTFSFIIKMYEMVYRQFSGLMGVEEHEIEKHSHVFANTLGLVRGRVYYNLLSWYKMLAMLPGYSINAEYMEKMMGVKERFELEEDYQMSKGMARFRILKMVFKMLKLQRRLPKERGVFMKQLNAVMKEYHAIDFEKLSVQEIVAKYKIYETDLLLKWKAPLINDFFAMIWFGMLQKQTTKYLPDHPNIHNDLLCGSQDIISVEPIHKTFEITEKIMKIKDCLQLFKEETPEEIWRQLELGFCFSIKREIEAYISKFGERCVGELKLETISHSQEPVLYVKILKSYIKQGITAKKGGDNIEETLRVEAEQLIFGKLKGKPIKKAWFKYVLNKTRDVVSNRENLRFERTRGFGMVRKMFSALGKKLYENGDLKHYRDVFYMKLDEIKSLDKFNFTDVIKDNIESRKIEFEEYKNQKPPEERFFTHGFNFADKYIYSTEKLEPLQEDLKGIGCCPGLVQGKVRIVLDPNDVESLNGDILVTSSTDPGWVTLFPTASAIIVERGSLLSHSAIVSREMGIPCIVSVTGLLRTLKTGDEIIMNGRTGMIEIVENA